MAITAGIILPRIDFNWSKDPILVHLNSDIDQSTFAVRVAIDILIYYNGMESNPIFLEGVPNEDGDIFFDISGILDEAIGDNFTPPVPGAPNIIEVQNSPIEFLVEYFEYQDEIEVEAGVVNDFNNAGDPYRVMQGGTAIGSNVYNSYWDSWFMANYPIVPFLSWTPSAREVRKNQMIPLYWLNYDQVDDDDVFMEIKVYNETTNVATDDTTYQFNPAQLYTIYKILVGWNELNIDAILTAALYTGAVTHYTIRLIDGDGDPVSETKTYYVDEKVHRNYTLLVYQNSVNGFDDEMFFGEIEEKIDSERFASSMNGLSGFAPPDGTRRTFFSKEQHSKKFNTGYLSPLQIQALRGIMLSQRIYEMDLLQGFLNPVELTEKTKQLIKSNDYLNGIPLEYKYTFKNRSWNPRNLPIV